MAGIGEKSWGSDTPEFLYVVDPSRGEATLVQKVECRSISTAFTQAVAATSSSTSTATPINDATLATLPQVCEVFLKTGNYFILTTSITNADAGRVIRGFWDERIDGDDCMWAERVNVWPDWLAQPIQLAGLANGDVVVGERDFEDLQGRCSYKPYFLTRETTRRVRLTLPTAMAEALDFILVETGVIYSSVAPPQARCVLVPGLAAAPGGPIVQVHSSTQLYGPPNFVPAGGGTYGAAGQGIPEAGMSDYGMRA